MSTRAQIKIKGYPVLIYKHSDGYPDGVLPIIEPYMKKFLDNRGIDKEYAIARLMMRFGVVDKEHHEEMHRHDPDTFDNESFIGYGLSTELHGDIEFLYIIDLENQKINIVDRFGEVSIRFFG